MDTTLPPVHPEAEKAHQEPLSPQKKATGPGGLLSKKHRITELRILASLKRRKGRVLFDMGAACFLFFLISPAVFGMEALGHQESLPDERTAGINIERMTKAIYFAEGGKHAKKPFGVLSVKCSGTKGCESVCRNSVRRNILRWKKAGRPSDFISFMQKRYAPLSDSPLNANWSKNVKRLYKLFKGKVV